VDCSYLDTICGTPFEETDGFHAYAYEIDLCETIALKEVALKVSSWRYKMRITAKKTTYVKTHSTPASGFVILFTLQP